MTSFDIFPQNWTRENYFRRKPWTNENEKCCLQRKLHALAANVTSQIYCLISNCIHHFNSNKPTQRERAYRMTTMPNRARHGRAQIDWDVSFHSSTGSGCSRLAMRLWMMLCSPHDIRAQSFLSGFDWPPIDPFADLRAHCDKKKWKSIHQVLQQGSSRSGTGFTLPHSIEFITSLWCWCTYPEVQVHHGSLLHHKEQTSKLNQFFSRKLCKNCDCTVGEW